MESEKIEKRRQPARKPVKKRPNSNNKKSSIIPVIILLVLFLMFITGITAFYILYGSQNAKAKGDWITQVSIKDEIVKNANEYLKEAVLGDEIDMSDYFDDANVSVLLSVNKDGTYTKRIDDESVLFIESTVEEAMVSATADLILLRLKSVDPYYEKDEEPSKLVEQSIGMSLEDYLKAYGPSLVPQIDVLKERFEDEGTCTIENETITFVSSKTGKTCSYNYAVNGSILVLYSSFENDSAVYNRINAKEGAGNE